MCVEVSPWPFYLSCAAIMLGVGLGVAVRAKIGRALALALVVSGGLLLTERPVDAYPQIPFSCEEMRAAGTWCWVLVLFGCDCEPPPPPPGGGTIF